MSRKKKREEQASVAPGFDASIDGAVVAPTTGRVTPMDIQQKSFGKTTMRRGYDEREVDQFLDEVTEELARQIAENKGLREQVQRAGMRETTALGSDAADADAVVRQARAEAARILSDARDDAAHVVAEARGEAVSILDAAHGEAGTVPGAGPGPAAAGVLAAGAVGATGSPGDAGPDRAFIHREREFLQSLAELIQAHAEAIREDLKRVRATGSAPDDDVPDAGDEPEGGAPVADPPPGPEAGTAGAGPSEVATAEASAQDLQAAAEPAMTTEPAASDEPAMTSQPVGPEVPEATEDVAVPGAIAAVAEPTPDEGPVATGAEAAAAAVAGAAAAEAARSEDRTPPEPLVGGEAAAAEVSGVGAVLAEAATPEPSDEPALLDLTDSEREEDGGPVAQTTADAEAGEGEEGPEPPEAGEREQAPEPAEAPEPAAQPEPVGVTAGASSGTFGRWIEETGPVPSELDIDQEEGDGRSLRELFWGED